MFRMLIEERLERAVRVAEFFLLPLPVRQEKICGRARRRIGILRNHFLKIRRRLCLCEQTSCRLLAAIGIEAISAESSGCEQRNDEGREHFFLVPVPKGL